MENEEQVRTPSFASIPIPRDPRHETLAPAAESPERAEPPMCGCAAAIARAVVDFLDAVLVVCFRSWFTPHRDPPAHKDRRGEVLSDEEKGFGASKSSDEHLEDDRGIVKELRQEADYLKLCGTISQTPAELQNVSSEVNLETTNEVGNVSAGTSVSRFNSSECLKCEEDYTLMTEIKVPQVESVDSVPQSVREKSPFWSTKNRSRRPAAPQRRPLLPLPRFHSLFLPDTLASTDDAEVAKARSSTSTGRGAWRMRST